MYALYALFSRLLNMSLSAGILALVVAALRLVLRRAPKWLLCALWALVAVRLVLPFSVSAPFSAYRALDAENTGHVEYFHYNGRTEKPLLEFPTPAPESQAVRSAREVKPQHTSDLYLPYLMQFWLLGVAAMLAYAIVSSLRLYRQVRANLPLTRRFRLCDGLETPFILGVFRPRVYLPSSLDADARMLVMAHESAHLRRGDHLWKPLGFALLTIHWFNPALWLAYILLCRDIELACDEKVIASMAPGGKRAYSEALLQCAAPRRFPSACPLAFGEVGTKERIRRVLNYKKPAFWVVLAALLAAFAVAACFLTDPARQDAPPEALADGRYVSEACVYLSPLSSYLPLGGDSGCVYTVDGTQFSIVDRASGTVQTFQPEPWEWQPLPWSTQQWQQLFLGDAPPLDEAHYQPLDETHGLIWTNRAIWLVELRNGSVWSIYSIVYEAGKGRAQWDCQPLSSAGTPGFPFTFDFSYDELQAVCTEGSLIDLAHLTASGYPEGRELTIPSGGTLCWLPLEALRAEIYCTCTRDGASGAFTLYLTGEAISDGIRYTADIVGEGFSLGCDAQGVATIRSAFGAAASESSRPCYTVLPDAPEGSVRWRYDPQYAYGTPGLPFCFCLDEPATELSAQGCRMNDLASEELPEDEAQALSAQDWWQRERTCCWLPLLEGGELLLDSAIDYSCTQDGTPLRCRITIHGEPSGDGTLFTATPAADSIRLEADLSQNRILVLPIAQPEEPARLVMVNGVLYRDTGELSTLSARCGTPDGIITSTVPAGTVPTQDGQSNFGAELEYQWFAEDTIEVRLDDGWYVFRAV